MDRIATRSGHRLRILELYSGIGGAAVALGTWSVEVVAAVDINHLAAAVYRSNLPHPVEVLKIDAVGRRHLRRWQADLWWLSPPCQPFTRRGRRRDDDDPRSASLLALLAHLERERPPYLALENVPGFAGSRTWRRLRDALERAGYRIGEHELCPSEIGWPNRRRRYYLVATRDGVGLQPLDRLPRSRRRLRDLLDPAPAAGLEVDPGLLRRYRGALDLVRADDPAAITACFTSAYGRSPVWSGSYLALDAGDLPAPGSERARRFSPHEVLRLLGFPEGFRFPDEIGRAQAWRLAGNSLSVPAVRRVAATLLPSAPGGHRASGRRSDQPEQGRAEGRGDDRQEDDPGL